MPRPWRWRSLSWASEIALINVSSVHRGASHSDAMLRARSIKIVDFIARLGSTLRTRVLGLTCLPLKRTSMSCVLITGTNRGFLARTQRLPAAVKLGPKAADFVSY